MNNKGQSILSEQVMIIFAVIAALVAMTVFVQRGFEARINDVRSFMVSSVVNNQVCDANCLAATGNNISYEYEPYYAQALTDVAQNQESKAGATTGNAQIIGAVYTKAVNEQTHVISTSSQLPPKCANGGC